MNINPANRSYELEFTLRQAECNYFLSGERFKEVEYAQVLSDSIPELTGADPRNRFALGEISALAPRRVAGSGTGSWGVVLAAAFPCRRHLCAQLEERQASLDFDDVINIQYTSGTTGFPKGAMLTHHNILNNAFFIGEGMRFTHRDRLCIPVPFYHCFGMVLGNLACVTHGATMVLPAPHFSPLQTLQSVEQERCTALHGVPTMFIAELDHPDFNQFNLSTLRTGIMAGAPVPSK